MAVELRNGAAKSTRLTTKPADTKKATMSDADKRKDREIQRRAAAAQRLAAATGSISAAASQAAATTASRRLRATTPCWARQQAGCGIMGKRPWRFWIWLRHWGKEKRRPARGCRTPCYLMPPDGPDAVEPGLAALHQQARLPLGQVDRLLQDLFPICLDGKHVAVFGHPKRVPLGRLQGRFRLGFGLARHRRF